jgi:serine protease Do
MSAFVGRSLLRPRAVLALVGVAATSAVSACGDRAGSFVAPSSAAAQRAPVLQQIDASRRTAFVSATEKVRPAVVSISVQSRERVQASSPFDFFFVPQDAERAVSGSGTGFVLRADGIILTNQHVVANADTIVVTLADGSELPGELVGEDATTDIAVVRIRKRGLVAATIGRSTDLLTGEWVVALGNPYAFVLGNSDPTVTVGVVSATGRNILPSDDQPGLYLDMIQTDAAINPGNSGGPLTNALGEIVGVNSSILSNSGGSVGLGFAIPIERAVRVADELLRSGTVRRAWVGLEVDGPAAMRNWKTAGGVVVASVSPVGPAAKAGLRAGDVLTAANGRRLRNYLDWEAIKLDLHVGDAVEVTLRDGTRKRLVSGDLPSVSAEKVTVLKDLQLVTLTASVRAEFRVRSDAGAVIYRISDNAGRGTGLQSGDVIVALNNQRIQTAEQVDRMLAKLRPREPFRLYFERDGRILFTDLAF